ncbi:MAG: sigma-70 family RNA polymerase sigma factor [Candidatus Hydrogenedentes bacterium]|nr:sigma-70 family RNA polymerase sigma factor [Candidatus Hydrogenedentota bacterium]
MDLQESIAPLVENALAGDERSFTELIRRHEDFAYGVAIGLLGDFELARDVVQEAFLCVHRDLSNLKEPQRFSGWLCGIVRHTAFRALRELERVRRLADEVEREASASPPVPGPDQDLRRREQHAVVMRALNRLSDANREVMSLFYVHDLSYAQIAAFLDVPESTVLGRLQRGRTQLRKEMEMVEKTFKDEALPDDFAEQIQRLLDRASEDKREEKRSVEKLNILGTAAVEPLCEALEDPRDTVRLVAARALCKIGDSRALNPILRQLYGYHDWQGPGVRWKRRLVGGEGLLDIPGVREELLRLLDDPNHHQDPWVYGALSRAKGDDEVFKRLMGALRTPLTESYYLHSVLSAACELRPDLKTDIVVVALNSQALLSRWAAAWYAGRNDMTIPIEACLRAFADGMNWCARLSAGHLIRLHGEEGERTLLRLIECGNESERISAAMSLADTGNEKAFQILKDDLFRPDRDRQWRRVISNILGKYYGPRFLAWAESEPELAMANRDVAWTLARSRGDGESDLVARMFREGTPAVQVAAMRYLVRLRGVEFLPELRRCIREGKPSKVAEEALKELMGLGEQIRPELEEMLNADHWAERRAAVVVLGASGKLTAAQIETLATDRHIAVRNAATKARPGLQRAAN